MDFDYSPKTKELQAKLNQFMADYVYPAESAYADELAANTAAGKRWTPLKTIENLKPKAQAQGLWNLFLPVDSAAESGYSGAGLTFAEWRNSLGFCHDRARRCQQRCHQHPNPH